MLGSEVILPLDLADTENDENPEQNSPLTVDLETYRKMFSKKKILNGKEYALGIINGISEADFLESGLSQISAKVFEYIPEPKTNSALYWKAMSNEVRRLQEDAMPLNTLVEKLQRDFKVSISFDEKGQRVIGSGSLD